MDFLSLLELAQPDITRRPGWLQGQALLLQWAEPLFTRYSLLLQATSNPSTKWVGHLFTGLFNYTIDRYLNVCTCQCVCICV